MRSACGRASRGDSFGLSGCDTQLRLALARCELALPCSPRLREYRSSLSGFRLRLGSSDGPALWLWGVRGPRFPGLRLGKPRRRPRPLSRLCPPAFHLPLPALRHQNNRCVALSLGRSVRTVADLSSPDTASSAFRSSDTVIVLIALAYPPFFFLSRSSTRASEAEPTWAQLKMRSAPSARSLSCVLLLLLLLLLLHEPRTLLTPLPVSLTGRVLLCAVAGHDRRLLWPVPVSRRASSSSSRWCPTSSSSSRSPSGALRRALFREHSSSSTLPRAATHAPLPPADQRVRHARRPHHRLVLRHVDRALPAGAVGLVQCVSLPLLAIPLLAAPLLAAPLARAH